MTRNIFQVTAISLLLCTFLVFPNDVHAQVTNWTNPGSGNWGNPANWSAGVPTNTATATIIANGTAVIDGATVPPATALVVNVGTSTALGTLLVVAGGSLSTPTLSVGFSNNIANPGIMNISGGQVAVSGSFSVGRGPGALGSLTITGGTTSIAGGASPEFMLGDGPLGSPGTGTMSMSNGLLNVVSNLFIGGDPINSGTGFLTITGGTITTQTLFIGRGTFGTLTASSGVITATNGINISGFGGSVGQGSLIVSGGTVTAGPILFGNGVSPTGTMALISGLLSTSAITANNATQLLTLNGGTLRATGSTANFISGFAPGAFTVGTNGGFIDTNGFGVAINSPISGPGGMIVASSTGNGALTFTTNNTYTGTTTINPTATLQLGNGGTTGIVVSAVIQDNGILIFNRSDAVPFSGTIQGSGGLNQIGTGTTILTANNTYTGSTTIGAGTLQLGNGAATGFIVTPVIGNSGILAFNRSDAVTFPGTIQGSGGLNQIGTGTTILTGNNTYTGSTTIAAGALQLGNGGASGAILGNITNNGALIANRSNALNLPGSIVGSGSFLQIGTGATTLGGNNSYAGGTVITSGTLIGSTASLQGAISNSSELVFSQTVAGGFTGTISGAGNMTVNSPGGAVQFNTNQPYTGTTTINAGGLSVNAQLSSSTVIINPTGILSGTGTLIGNVINAGGEIRPGTSPGILTINGNYTQAANGTLTIEIASNSSFDQLVIGGSASLDGTLAVSLLGGFSPTSGSTFTILTAAGGVSGTFSNLNLPAGFPLQVIYDPTDVRLVFLGSISGSTAQQAAATSATSSLGAMTLLLSVLNVPFSEVVPGLAGTVKDILFNVANTEYSQVTTRLAAVRSGVNPVTVQGIPQEPMAQQFSKHQAQYDNKFGLRSQEVSHWDIYAFTSGIFAKLDNISNLPKINSNSGYFGMGADCRINDYVSVGVYSGYQGVWARYARDSRLQSNGIKYGIYGTAFWEGFYLNAIVGGGANFLNFSRSINIAEASWTARGHPFAGELDSLLGGGYEYRWKSWIFGANTSIQYTYLGISGFRESQADALNVRVNGQTPSSLVYTLGGNISYLWEISPNYKILPTLGLSWQHEFLNYGQQIAAAFANGAGAPFFFNSLTAARNNALGFAGITAQIGRRLGAWFYYTPQFGGGQIYSNAFQLGLSVAF